MTRFAASFARSPKVRAALVTATGLAFVVVGYEGPWPSPWTWLLATVGWGTVGSSVAMWTNAFRFGTDDAAMVRHVTRWAAVTAGTPVAVTVCDERTRVVWCSGAWVEATGVDRRRATGRPLWTMLDVDAPAPSGGHDVHVRHHGGRRTWMHVEATPITSETGRSIGTAWFFSDAEERLASQAHERRAFDIMRAAAFASESFVRKPHWSDAFEAIALRLAHDDYRVNLALYRWVPGDGTSSTDPAGTDLGAGAPHRGDTGWIAERYASFPPGAHDVVSISTDALRLSTHHDVFAEFGARGLRLPVRLRVGTWGAWLAAGSAIAWGGPDHASTEVDASAVSDGRTDARTDVADAPWPTTCATYVAPIVVGDEPWGMLAFESDALDVQWTPVERLAFRTSADAVSAAIERSTVEATLDRERSLASETLAAIQQGVAVVDRDGKIVLANRALADMLGSTVDQLVGRGPSALGLGLDAVRPGAPGDDAASEAWTDTFTARGSVSTGWARRSDGADRDEHAPSTLQVHATWRAIDPLAGHTIVIVTDVTERTRLDDDLRDALHAAHAANLTKSRFLASVSHELRTPMNAVLGYAQLAALDATQTSQQEALERITTAGRHMTAMIEDLLDIAAAEAGLLDVRRLPVDLVEATRSAIGLVSVVASGGASTDRDDRDDQGAHDGPIQLIAPSGDVAVVGDHRRIVQVVSNLVDNALKFGPPHQPVVVEVDFEEHARFATVRVTDAGAGLPPSDVDRLFEPFERGAATRKPGRGIGLSVCKALVEGMGGSIAVTTSGEAGCTFSVTLPLANEASTYVRTGKQSVTAER